MTIEEIRLSQIKDYYQLEYPDMNTNGWNIKRNELRLDHFRELIEMVEKCQKQLTKFTMK